MLYRAWRGIWCGSGCLVMRPAIHHNSRRRRNPGRGSGPLPSWGCGCRVSECNGRRAGPEEGRAGGLESGLSCVALSRGVREAGRKLLIWFKWSSDVQLGGSRRGPPAPVHNVPHRDACLKHSPGGGPSESVKGAVRDAPGLKQSAESVLEELWGKEGVLCVELRVGEFEPDSPSHDKERWRT